MDRQAALRNIPVTSMYSFQNTHSCGSHTVKSMANVVSMGACAVLNQSLSSFRHARYVQILQFISTPETWSERQFYDKRQCQYFRATPGFLQNYEYTDLRFLNGDFGMSAVGIICSPGRAHRMGPSLLRLRGSPFTSDMSPHGMAYFKNGFLSIISRKSGK